MAILHSILILSERMTGLHMDKRFDIYCDILYRGLINIRTAAREGDFKRCEMEADHLHNLPDLLKNYDNEQLHDYYWNCMRPDETEHTKCYQELWNRLKEAKEEK